MTEQELAEIEARWTPGGYCPDCEEYHPQPDWDVFTLIAEVHWLRKQLTGYENWVADAVEFYHLQPDCDGFDTWHEERQKAG